MIRNFLIAAGSAMFFAAAHAQIPVTDGAALGNNIIHHVENIAYYKDQLDQLRGQVEAAERMYKNTVGKRDIAGLLNDKLVQQYLPPDLQQTIQQIRSGKVSGISGSLKDIVRMNQARDCALYGDPTVQARCKAEWQSYAMNQYVGETGYAKATAEIDDLQRYVDTIKSTEDPKAMQDLQARIQLSQIKVQAEVSKLQYLQQAQKAREEMDRRNSIDKTVKMLKPGMIRF